MICIICLKAGKALKTEKKQYRTGQHWNHLNITTGVPVNHVRSRIGAVKKDHNEIGTGK